MLNSYQSVCTIFSVPICEQARSPEHFLRGLGRSMIMWIPRLNFSLTCFADLQKTRHKCKTIYYYFILFIFYSIFILAFHKPSLKSNFMNFWREFLILKKKASLPPIIFAPSGQMIRRQRGTRTSPVESLVSLLTFLSITSTFVLEARFSGRLLVYPMGTNSAPLLADLFLHTFEYIIYLFKLSVHLVRLITS